jgi:DNA polymerase III subunit delta
MKLTYFQLEQQIAKQLAPAYMIGGEELLSRQDTLNMIRKAAKQAGFTERVKFAPEAAADWEQLFSILNSGSLMADKRIIELDFTTSQPNKAAAAILCDYAERPSPDTLLLISLNKIDDKVTKSAWYKSLDKIGVSVPIWPVTRDQLPQWLHARAKKYKLQLQQDAVNMLADFVEGNLSAAAQAIEKLYLLRPEKTVDCAMVETALTDESSFSVFDLVEHTLTGDKARTLHILENLKNDGTEATLVLWSLTRELRLLADIAREQQEGKTLEYLFQKYRIFTRRQPAMRRALSRMTPDKCWQQLSSAAHIDTLIKGAAPGNTWNALELLCLRLS